MVVGWLAVGKADGLLFGSFGGDCGWWFAGWGLSCGVCVCVCGRLHWNWPHWLAANCELGAELARKRRPRGQRRAQLAS